MLYLSQNGPMAGIRNSFYFLAMLILLPLHWMVGHCMLLPIILSGCANTHWDFNSNLIQITLNIYRYGHDKLHVFHCLLIKCKESDIFEGNYANDLSWHYKTMPTSWAKMVQCLVYVKQGWRSGAMWLGSILTQCLTWVEFGWFSPCSEGVYSGSLVFLPP